MILGGDAFLDYWGEQQNRSLGTVEGVLKIIEASYSEGVRGMDVSMNPHVIKAFNVFNQKKSLIGFANPNWLLKIISGNNLLWDVKAKFDSYIINKYHEQIFQLKQENIEAWKDWFEYATYARPATDSEIRKLKFDTLDYRNRLQQFKGICKYCLIGGNYADWAILLNRIDIIKQQIEVTLEEGFIPISITHFPSETLHKLEELDVQGHWILLSKDRQLFTKSRLRKTLSNITKPVFCFRTLGFGRLSDNIGIAFEYLVNEYRPQGIVVGVENEIQAKESFSILRKTIEKYQYSPLQ